MKKTYWVVIWDEEILHLQLYPDIETAHSFAKEYIGRDYKIVKVKLNEKK